MISREHAIANFTAFHAGAEAEKLDPEDEFVWQGVAAGYFFGLGFSAEESYKMSEEWYCS